MTASVQAFASSAPLSNNGGIAGNTSINRNSTLKPGDYGYVGPDMGGVPIAKEPWIPPNPRMPDLKPGDYGYVGPDLGDFIQSSKTAPINTLGIPSIRNEDDERQSREMFELRKQLRLAIDESNRESIFAENPILRFVIGQSTTSTVEDAIADIKGFWEKILANLGNVYLVQ